MAGLGFPHVRNSNPERQPKGNQAMTKTPALIAALAIVSAFAIGAPAQAKLDRPIQGIVNIDQDTGGVFDDGADDEIVCVFKKVLIGVSKKNKPIFQKKKVCHDFGGEE
jgi:hypothetical protein